MAGFQVPTIGNLVLQQGRPRAPLVDVSLVRAAVKTKAEVVIEAAKAGKRSYTKITNKMIAEMRARRSTGETIRSIALSLNVADCTVGVYVAGVNPPPGGWQKGGPKPKGSIEQIARMRRAGFTYREIAENFGVTENAITKRLKPYPSMFKSRPKPLHIQAFQIVQRVTGIKAGDIRRTDLTKGLRPSDEVMRARWIVAFLLVRKRSLSFHIAGKYLGGYDFSSIEHMVKRADAKMGELGLSHELPMRAIARALWLADWSLRKAA